MALTAGSLSKVSGTDVAMNMLASAAVSGTTPYTYQWYRSTASAAFPATTSVAISGATALTLADTGLTPGTTYYYRVVATDSNATPQLATYTGVSVATLAPVAVQNVFTQSPILGMTDLKLNFNTLSVQFDPAGSGTLVAGMAVKWSTVSGGAPKVVPSTAQADVVCGFVNYDIKSASYVAGDRLEISQVGNVMYLYAALAINRGTELCSIPAAIAGGCNGGVVPVTGSSGFPIVGFALDTGVIGSLIRVELRTPSGKLDS